MVERDGVEAALRQPRQAGIAVRRVRHLETVPPESLLNQAAEGGIVVDEEKPDRLPRFAHGASGICITDRKRPSWRIACAKVS